MALQVGVFQFCLRVERNFLVLRLNQVEDDVATVLVLALSIAEPFMAVMVQALDNSLRVVYATVGAGMWWQVLEVIRLQGLLTLRSDT